ncbi:bifunctional adenosylcobinamide kinase/adenosylcobinamide-phosphate guanylyltransferase [Salinispira pacifica]|uniref:Adenosylcobinamide kinase n=1 Tax=Salinispira pacifica TaxID=1307761 RepID=V5WIH0_9SPIO|nr:bifunctional adenosylcobinamide kinase/adenosylcobinamide-phosphate guanylyltransferase [Salinispira pacifica]AHC15425.1 Adenosylcobinamide-phosphate guanylyltransferase [Salinispira pacifica]
MRELTYISGGQRSGKSRYAQQLALGMSASPVYLATARIWDDEFRTRIQRHRSDRDERWRTVEIDRNISDLGRHLLPEGLHIDGEATSNSDRGITEAPDSPVILLDCITLWVTNFFSDAHGNMDSAMEQIIAEWDRFALLDIRAIVVSNEIGMGVMPDNELARKFADLQGFINQHIAGHAQRQILMLSGSALEIKGAPV